MLGRISSWLDRIEEQFVERHLERGFVGTLIWSFMRLGVGRLIYALALASVALTGGPLNGPVLVLCGSTYLLPDRRPRSEERPQCDGDSEAETDVR